MEAVNLKVKGMTCSNCALSVSKYLEKQGMQNVKVNPIDGDVHFEAEKFDQAEQTQLSKGIASLGYEVVDEKLAAVVPARPPMNKYLRYTLLCLPFTLVLMLHMLPAMHDSWINNPWLQLALCLPVYIIGMYHFGTSAVRSTLHGMPNMNVLVAVGATAAFVYSLIGAIRGMGHDYLFFETTATIITLVFFGNYLEDVSINSTQQQLNALAKQQPSMANMIAFDDKYQEQIFAVEAANLKSGDLVLIKNGEQVPADAKILSGDGMLNEAVVTGESVPVRKTAKDKIIGGSLLVDGILRAQVLHSPKEGILANIIDLVKKAQGDKPPIQRLADRISAIFVPTVIGIALLTFIINYVVLHDFTPALMRAIAVLVISCPCAMGLATPAAIAVGLGRAAKNGVLFRNAQSLEIFKQIKQVVFDKTGTLTTGAFSINGFDTTLPEEEFKSIVWSLEKYSNHPLAKSITTHWKGATEIRWASVEEIKGSGIRATNKSGDEFRAGSAAFAGVNKSGAAVYLTRNAEYIGSVNLADEIRPEAPEVINYLHSKGIVTVLLSGDSTDKVQALADKLQIKKVYAQQSPADKLTVIDTLKAAGPTAMVGDGINDAPALAKADVGISLSDSSQVAMQTADVVLMNNGLKQLPLALGLGLHTMKTIRGNLFWAFAYNVVAIPIAAFGFLTPGVAALAMGLSDVVLALNSGRLYVKKVT
ncbi:MAG: cadmium-translocating P-type ATPase [Bacteroidetes bacterium]|nr:cadmium-translocating P-type ATPase [Bacteroidota bacterium]